MMSLIYGSFSGLHLRTKLSWLCIIIVPFEIPKDINEIKFADD